MNCSMCKWKLTELYVKYHDVKGNPYCIQCYIEIGGNA